MSRVMLAMIAMAALSLAGCTPLATVQQRDGVATASPDAQKQPEPYRQPEPPTLPNPPTVPEPSKLPDPPNQPDANAQSDRSAFALAVNVREKAVTGRRLSGAAVRLPGTNIDVMTDLQGRTGPLRIALTNYEHFPYDVHVSKAGYQTCVIKFGSMIFPVNTRLSQYNEVQPAQLFVYMPTGDGIATGDECYGGRTQPQTMGPNK